MPTLYLLHELFCHPWKKETPLRESAAIDTTIYLQDFNALVLELVTFPNILLTWCAFSAPLCTQHIFNHIFHADISPLANDYRETNPPDTGNFNVHEPGEVVITPALIEAFRASLKEESINLRFFSGSWVSLTTAPFVIDDPFDVILTSETIYNLDSLPKLVDLIQRAYLGKALYESQQRRLASQHEAGDILDVLTATLSLDTRPQRFGWPICIAAAKVLYFGVGGGVAAFERLVNAVGGRPTIVMNKTAGVGRKLIQVDWPHNG